jgi:hypothetical protein
MNITLSVDKRVAENAREAARKMGKTAPSKNATSSSSVA